MVKKAVKYTGVNISEETMMKLIRIRGWLDYHDPKRRHFNDIISELCDLFEKHKEKKQ